MKKYTLYCGLNDKDTKRQEISTLEAAKMVRNACLSYADGATIFEATGFTGTKPASSSQKKRSAWN